MTRADDSSVPLFVGYAADDSVYFDSILRTLIEDLKGVDVVAYDPEAGDGSFLKLIRTQLMQERSPEDLAAAIEPTAPMVAAQIRSLKTPEAVVAYINALVAVINLIIAIVNAVHDSPAPAQINQIVNNIQTTNITINPPPPPTAPPK